MRANRTGGVRPKLNSHGHVVLCLLVSLALHRLGVASACPTISMNRNVGQASRLPPSATPTERNRSRWRARWAGETPALRWARPGSWSRCMITKPWRPSTNNAQSGKASVRNVDFTEVPEAKELAESARRIGNEMYPKILALLADGASKLPPQFDIVFKKRLEGNFGQTVGATINLRAEWFAKNPTDLDATLIHEMSHVAQKYPSKAWDYWGEGMADYACYKLGYTNEWNWPHCSFEYPHYTSGYCCAGAFLVFLDATYGSNVVRELNAELRRGSYPDSVFARATGRSLDALWVEFQNTPAFTPVAAETLKLQAELGYVNGQPPKDVGRRLTAYLLQQPGGALTLEASEFLAKLIENDQLPGILKLHGREFPWGIGGPNLRTEASSAAYPASRTFCGRRTDDPYAYYCLVVRLSKESGWQLQRAWRAVPDGRVITEYPVR